MELRVSDWGSVCISRTQTLTGSFSGHPRGVSSNTLNGRLCTAWPVGGGWLHGSGAVCVFVYVCVSMCFGCWNQRIPLIHRLLVIRPDLNQLNCILLRAIIFTDSLIAFNIILLWMKNTSAVAGVIFLGQGDGFGGLRIACFSHRVDGIFFFEGDLWMMDAKMNSEVTRLGNSF